MHLVNLAAGSNPGFSQGIAKLEGQRVSEDILSEKEFEDYLVKRLSVLKPEFDLKLFKDEAGDSGQQYPCVEGKSLGFIDLLTLDAKTGGFTVVELKRGRASREAVAQISTYMGWVRQRLAGVLPVRGLVISDGYDEKFAFARSAVPDLYHIELATVRIKLGI